MCILSDCEEFSLHRFRQAQDRKHRILYTGNDLALLKFLEERLKDCLVVRAPSGYVGRVLIKGESGYSLFLFDKELPDETGRELESFTRTRHEYKPVIVIRDSDKFSSIAKDIANYLSQSHDR